MSDSIIQVENLGKRYRIGKAEAPYKTIREAIVDAAATPFRNLAARFGGSRNGNEERVGVDTIWALKGVSFEVEQGEVVGVIGRNGSGKSTLLKILSRITEPTEGEVRLRGRVASLLEVGTGFHPELTGRENIYLNGAILGMKKREIERRFGAIVSFAEIQKFLDTPVKRYSSGMFVRLAFAVAAHLEPEILVVDEVLSVGDMSFQRKCLGKMREVATGGRTVFFVSHNLKAVEALCNRAILLDGGALRRDGKPTAVIEAYRASMDEESKPENAAFVYEKRQSMEGQILAVRVLNSAGSLCLRHGVLDPIRVEMDFELHRDFPTLILFVEVWTQENIRALVSQDSDWDNYIGETMQDQFPRSAGRYHASFEIPTPLLNHGTYELELALTVGPERIDTRRGIYVEIKDELSFLSYVTKSNRGGVIAVPIPWQVERTEQVRNPEGWSQ